MRRARSRSPSGSRAGGVITVLHAVAPVYSSMGGPAADLAWTPTPEMVSDVERELVTARRARGRSSGRRRVRCRVVLADPLDGHSRRRARRRRDRHDDARPNRAQPPPDGKRRREGRAAREGAGTDAAPEHGARRLAGVGAPSAPRRPRAVAQAARRGTRRRLSRSVIAIMCSSARRASRTSTARSAGGSRSRVPEISFTASPGQHVVQVRRVALGAEVEHRDQVRRVVPRHGRAAAAHAAELLARHVGHVDDLDPAQRGLLARVPHEVALGRDRELVAGLGVGHRLPEIARRAGAVGDVDDDLRALRVHEHAVAARPPVRDLRRREDRVHAAEAAPEHHLRRGRGARARASGIAAIV